MTSYGMLGFLQRILTKPLFLTDSRTDPRSNHCWNIWDVMYLHVVQSFFIYKHTMFNAVYSSVQRIFYSFGTVGMCCSTFTRLVSFFYSSFYFFRR